MFERDSEKILEGNISYTRGRYNYLVGSHDLAQNDFLFTIRYGDKSLLIKSLLMIGMLQCFKVGRNLKNELS